jgi:hypothetical protein
MSGSLKLCVLAVLLAAVLAGCGGESSPDPVLVWAVGDGAAPGDVPRLLAARMAQDAPADVIYLGDVYETGTAKEFAANMAGVYRGLVKEMWPTPGNHDWPNHEVGYDPFWRAQLGYPLPEYYERSAGGWKILSLNSEDAKNPAQLKWLKQHAAAGGGNCRIAFWHRPALDAGLHRPDEPIVYGLWSAVRGRAAIVLSGHDHNMQRFKPLDGTVQYVSGAGGKGRYNVDESDHRLAWSNDQLTGALRIELQPGRADLSFVSEDGTVLDHTTVRCHQG